jgi:hypothetical protein
MRRRDFLLTSTALAAGAGGAFFAEQRMAATAEYPGRDAGHGLRDLTALPEPDETVQAEVLIAGSGVAGLTAAWQLRKRGVTDVLMVSGPERHGNAAAGSDGGLKFPTGAHYLPLPSMESWHIREMLADFGIIQDNPYAERPSFDERFIVHAPAERVCYRGAWQDGYLPTDDVGAAERAEHERFFALVEWYTAARGHDGLRAFAVPVERSSAEKSFRALDRLSFRAWLEGLDLKSPTLHWYLNYCCRDDYGRHYDEISAWAGLHYFCSRDGQAANAERGAVLTWPEGLSALAQRLEDAAGGADRWAPGSVARLRATPNGVEALVVESRHGSWRSYRVEARHAIAAMPLFVLQRAFPDISGYGFVGARDVPAYAPWLVSNFIMHAFPSEKPGAALAWDNVVYQEPGLGYVVSTHQDIRVSRPERTVFTAYHALSDLEPQAGRRWLEGASVAQLAALAGRDLRLAYGWRLPWCVERVAVTVRGHAMAIPEPGFLSNPGRLALRGAAGPLYFAHADLSGMSLFEEAAWWGYRAAVKLAASRAHTA